jgi:predicted phosphodiesterase
MLAVLSDIHGNLPAFEAVIADARARGAERFLLCGDYAAMGPWPAECVALAESLEPVAMLRGNHERWLTDRSDLPTKETALVAAVDWELAHLDAATIARQAALSQTATVDGALFCHASPSSDMESFQPRADPERDAALLGDVDAPRVVFGHYHLQFRRAHSDALELVGPGSVGLPADGDRRAAYATIAGDGTVELHRVIYDHRITLAAFTKIGSEWADWVAGILQNARFF